MFNGIIRNTAKIYKIVKKKNDCILKVNSKIKFTKSEIGSSISCSGTCLTLENYRNRLSTFYLSKETLDRTIFKFSKEGDIINIEKPLKFGDFVSGHFVQGHVHTTAIVSKIEVLGKSWKINFVLSKKFRKFLIEKGSIAINGVSLTISKIKKEGFQIVIIPKTLKLTNLIYLKKNDLVNVEFDILTKNIKINSSNFVSSRKQ